MNEWPAIYIFTTREIEKGDEIMGYYGENFGKALEELEAWNKRRELSVKDFREYCEGKGIPIDGFEKSPSPSDSTTNTSDSSSQSESGSDDEDDDE